VEGIGGNTFFKRCLLIGSNSQILSTLITGLTKNITFVCGENKCAHCGLKIKIHKHHFTICINFKTNLALMRAYLSSQQDQSETLFCLVASADAHSECCCQFKRTILISAI
jgi:hypothetical protein